MTKAARWSLFLLGLATALEAQAVEPSGPGIRWWEGAAVLGGIALVSALDEPVQRYTQAQRSRSGDQVAAMTRRMGQPEVFATVPGVLFVTGLVTRQPTLRRGAERVAASLALAGVLAVAGKFAVGRLRPSQAAEPCDLKPFSGADAFPSGHATMAFALATALADEMRRPWASVALLTAATGTAWSRVNDNNHWLSDVVAGAALGIGSAQIVEGRWTVLHIHPPAFFASPGRASIGWRIAVRVR